MAFALVGSAGTVSTGTAGAAVTPAYGAGATRAANNLLILQVLTTGSATLPAAISGWSIARQQAGTSCSASIYYKVAAGSDAAPTVPVVSGAIHNARLMEFSGGAVASPLDRSGATAGTTTPLTAVNSGLDSVPGELIIASAGAVQSAARVNTGMAHTFNNGVADTEVSNGATSTISHYNFSHGVTTGNASVSQDSFAFTTTQLTGAVIVIASFKLVLAAPVNTVAPAASGGTTAGDLILTTDGTWTGNPPPTFTYQWYRGATPISGATAFSYTTVPADGGQSITCQVTATNSSGSATKESNAIVPIPVGITYDDSRSGSGVTSGTSAESYDLSESASGTIVSSGSGTESWSGPIDYTDAASGTTTASGIGTNKHIYADDSTYYDNVIDQDSPVSHWKLGDPNTAIDRKGVTDLPAVGGPIGVAPGLVTNNASNSANTLTGVAGMQFSTGTAAGRGLPYEGAYTMEVWAKVTSAGDGRFMERGAGIAIGFTSTGSVVAFYEDSLQAQNTISKSLAIIVGALNHIVATHDGSTLILYVNGVEVVRASGINGTRSFPTAAPKIVAAYAGAWPNYIIDEAAWYPTALAPARVLAHYNAGVASGYDATIDIDNPVSHWKLGGTAQATDRKGVLNLPLVYGSVEAVKGLVANNGSDPANYLEKAPNFELVPSTNLGLAYSTPTWTMEAWVDQKQIPTTVSAALYRISNQAVVGLNPSGQWTCLVGSAEKNAPSTARKVGSGPHHLVHTFDSGTWIMYFDGVEVSRSTGVTTPLAAPDNAPSIGGRQGIGTAKFLGTIDEVAWYNVALSPARILEHYRVGLIPTIGVSGTSTESYVYSDSGSGTVTASGSGTEYYALPTPYSNVIDVDNPVSHWRLGSSTTLASDRKGIRDLPAVNGPISVVTGLVANNDDGQANRFVGATAQRFAPSSSDLAYVTANFSIEAWITPTSLASSRYAISRASISFGLGHDFSGKPSFRFTDAASVGTSINGSVSLVSGGVYHLVGTFDGVNAILYVNGIEIARSPQTGRQNVGGSPVIGGLVGSGNPFDGTIDEAAWYNTALSPERVLAHYQAGIPAGVNYNDSAAGTVTASGTGIETSDAVDIGVGTATISGTGVETASYTEAGTCLIAASGTSSDSLTYTEAASGTITASGTGTDSRIYTDAASGTITSSGTGTDSRAYTDATSGTITGSGTGTDAKSYSDTGIATVTSSGTGVEAAVGNDVRSGTITVSGTGVESYVAIFTDSAAGTIVASGTGTESAVHTGSATGTLISSGTSSETATHTETVTGTVTIAGVGTDTFEHIGIETGTAITSGTSLESALHSASATGTAVFSGTGIDSRVYTDVASGTALISGSSTETHEILIGYIDEGSGQINASGTSTESHSHTNAEIGSGLVNGTISESQSRTSTATGSVLVSGTGVESQAYADIAIGTFSIEGTSTEAQSHASISTGAVSAEGTSDEAYSHTSTTPGALPIEGTSLESHSHTSTATGYLVVSGTASESYQIIYTDFAEGSVTSTGTGAESVSYSDASTGATTWFGSRVESHDYTDSSTGDTVLTGVSFENYVYDDSSLGIAVLTGTSREGHSSPQPIPFSTIVALNPIKVSVGITAPIRSVVTITPPSLVQVTLQRGITAKVTKHSAPKITIVKL